MDLNVEIKYQYKNGDYLPDCMQLISSENDVYMPHSSTRYLFIDRNAKSWELESLPELYLRREECCGCSACYAVCPLSGPNRNLDTVHIKKIIIGKDGQSGGCVSVELTGAITLLPDEEGFLYPVVDASICSRCHLCLNVCGFKLTQKKSFD